MKFQSASKAQIKRISAGSGICLLLMLAGFYLLSFWGLCPFDYTVILSGAVGTLIAIGNFSLLCLTIQKAAAAAEQKKMKAGFQLSYNARLIVQAAWIVAAFLLPCFYAPAAAIPLLFPSVVISFAHLKERGMFSKPK